MKMEFDLKIFTLNVWGIVGISKNRKERITAIAAHLANSDYDFVFLQEVWSQEDYKYICKKASAVLPYSYYFYSGVFGSGVCILSKAKILNTAMNKYSLNGYAHKLQHGDWFGGKVAGLCKVFYSGLHINLYVSHLHAEYNPHHDQYLPHRVVQAFEFSQFVQSTSDAADLCIVAGDFNTEPTDLVYRIILNNACCHDSFVTQPKLNEMEDVGATCGHPRNTFVTRAELNECPTGKRLDYIMYRCKNGVEVHSLSCETPLNKIPGTDLSYSDHEAVVACLHVKKSSGGTESSYPCNDRIMAIEEGYQLLTKTLCSLHKDRIFYLVMTFIIACLVVVSVSFEAPFGFWILLVVIRIVLSVALAFCVWMGIIMNSIEHSSLLSAATGMKVILESFKDDDSSGLEKSSLGKFEIDKC